MKRFLYILFLLTSSFSFSYAQVISSFPWTDDFEGEIQGPTGCGPSYTFIGVDGMHNVTGDNLDWTADRGGTGSGGTGPSVDHTLGTIQGLYVYMESSCSSTGYPSKVAILQSPAFDLTGGNPSRLSFWYHMWGTSGGSMHFDVSADSGATWTLDYVPAWSNPNLDLWQEQEISLQDFSASGATPSSQFMFRVRGVSGSSFNSDFALDDFTIFSPIPEDIAIFDASILGKCSNNPSPNLKVDFFHNGFLPIPSGELVDFGFHVDGGTPVTETYTLPNTMQPGDSLSYTFSAGTGAGFNTNTYTVWSSYLPADSAQGNDTLVKVLTNRQGINQLPYIEDFETGPGSWIADNTNNGTWAFGTPNKTVIQGASSGVNAWVTGGLAGNYLGNDNSFVEGPCFNFSDTCIHNPHIEMDVWWNSEFSWDGANVQYSDDDGASWNLIGDFGDPENWYNDNTLNGSPGGDPRGWSGRSSSGSGSGSNGYLKARHSLPGVIASPDVRMRVYFGSDGSVHDEGFAFDDFRIIDNYASDECVAYSPAFECDANTGLFNMHNYCSNAGNDPAVPSCFSDGWDNSVYYPVLVIDTGSIDLDVLSIQGSGSLQMAVYGPFPQGSCPAPGSFGTPVFCTDTGGYAVSIPNVVPGNMYIVIFDGLNGAELTWDLSVGGNGATGIALLPQLNTFNCDTACLNNDPRICVYYFLNEPSPQSLPDFFNANAAGLGYISTADLLWFADNAGSPDSLLNGSGLAPSVDVSAQGSNYYWVGQGSSFYCGLSPLRRLEVKVLEPTPPNLIGYQCNQNGGTGCGTINIFYCQNETNPLTPGFHVMQNDSFVTGNTLNWYANTGGAPGASIPQPVPNLSTTGTTLYWVTQVGAQGAESDNPTEVRVTVRNSPVISVLPGNMCPGYQLDVAALVRDYSLLAVRVNFYDAHPDSGGVFIGTARMYRGIARSSDKVFVSPTVTTNYYVSALAANGCGQPLSFVVTINPNCNATIAPMAMLEGAFDQATSQQRSTLQQNALIPTTEPYTGLGYTFKGGGNETMNLSPTMTANIVDWVVVELRDANDPTYIVHSRAALMLDNGQVVDTDGISQVAVTALPTGSYYVAIIHRNHLGVMTARPVAMGTTVDFTDPNLTMYGSTNTRVVQNGKALLYAGDADGNGQVQNTDDVMQWSPTVGTSGYRQADYNLDGQVQNTDRVLIWTRNVGRGSAVPD